MSRALVVPVAAGSAWPWPVDLARYDRSPALSPAEHAALAALAARFRGRHPGRWPAMAQPALGRLAPPILDVLRHVEARRLVRVPLMKVLVQEMAARGTSYWAWTRADWLEVLCPSIAAFERRHQARSLSRACLIATAYLLSDLGTFADFQVLGAAERVSLARKVFGRPAVDAVLARVIGVAAQWGYGDATTRQLLGIATCELLLVNRSPRLEDLTAAVLDAVLRDQAARGRRAQLLVLSRVLHGLGIIDRAYQRDPAPRILEERYHITDGVAPEWVEWCQRWRDTATLGATARTDVYYCLLRAGHWLAQHHPHITSPTQWTRELAAAYVAAVCRMTVGQYGPVTMPHQARVGEPLSPRSKLHLLHALRIFFRDGLAWEWFLPRFDPRRCLGAPRSLRALIGPNPRVIADDLWAKLLWVGLNLEQADLSTAAHTTEHYYPLAMVRAVAAVWLFAGLRANEICRLRVGCIRWQARAGGLLDTSRGIPADAVCLLDVPVNKTETAFTKPVDRAVGEAIAAWEAVRPVQPALPDPKTGEVVDVLFAYRAKPMGQNYINGTLVRLLCVKGGIPEQDARGPITSHRARSTISSQLFNAKEPMSLFELQAWLGHRSPASTQHYTRVAPTTLARAYQAAGYFERNVRVVEVLVDQEVVRTSQAAAGTPWLFYDLGHGYCTYDYFEQCPHRMACAKCSFYRPKGSAQAQALEGKANLVRLLQEIPLREEERAAVEDGIAAHERLLAQLATVPPPDGGPAPAQRTGTTGPAPVVVAVAAVRRAPSE